MTLQGKVISYSAAELVTEITNVAAGSTIVVNTDVEFNSWEELNPSNVDYVLDLNGNTLKLATTQMYKYFDKKLTIKNGRIVGQISLKNVNVNFENITFQTMKSDMPSGYTNNGIVYIATGANATFTNCTFKTDGRHLETETTAYSLTIDGCKFLNLGGAAVPSINPIGNNPTTAVVVKNSQFDVEFNCEFYKNVNQFTITGNTFAKGIGFTPNAGGYYGDATDVSSLNAACKAFINAVIDANYWASGSNKFGGSFIINEKF